MLPALRSFVPLLQVQSVPRSIEFYRRLGFEIGNTFDHGGTTETMWAWLETGEARLMVARAGQPVVAVQQAVLFYLYCRDVQAMRQELEQAGVAVGPMQFPFYSPRGEFRVEDPDGYVIMVAHD